MNVDAYEYYDSKFYSSLFLRDVYEEIIRYNTKTIININDNDKKTFRKMFNYFNSENIEDDINFFIKDVAINCMVYKYSLFKLEKNGENVSLIDKSKEYFNNQIKYSKKNMILFDISDIYDHTILDELVNLSDDKFKYLIDKRMFYKYLLRITSKIGWIIISDSYIGDYLSDIYFFTLRLRFKIFLTKIREKIVKHFLSNILIKEIFKEDIKIYWKYDSS